MSEPASSVALQDRPAETAPSAPPKAVAATAAPGAEIPLDRKCPYLAGRPPHGSYHLCPSGANVCYARATGEKPYGRASKETQESRCFCGEQRFGCCPDYEQARARGVPLPIFEASGPSSTRSGAAVRTLRRHRVKQRRRRSALRRWLESSGKITLICACGVLLALAVFCLLLRSM
jgi:hypothetical protein